MHADLTMAMEHFVLPVVKMWEQRFRKAGCSVHLCLHTSGSLAYPRQKWWLTLVRRATDASATKYVCAVPNEWFPGWNTAADDDVEQGLRRRPPIDNLPADQSVFSLPLFSAVRRDNVTVRGYREAPTNISRLRISPLTAEIQAIRSLADAQVPPAFQRIQHVVRELHSMMREPTGHCWDVVKLYNCVRWLDEHECMRLEISAHLCVRSVYSADMDTNEVCMWLTFVDLEVSTSRPQMPIT